MTPPVPFAGVPARARAPRRRWIASGLVALALTAGAAIANARAEDVTIALSAGIATLNPQMATAVATDLSILSHIYQPLVIRNPDMSITGVVADSWTADDDLHWTIKLKDGLKFPNGKPLDAAVVKWNFDTLLAPENKSRVKLWYNLISNVDVISPTELKITTSAPFPGMIAQLSMFFLMEPEWAKSHDPAKETMGSGPYQMADYVPGERVVLKPNPAYSGSEPRYDQVTFRIIAEPAVRVAGLMAGELDLALDIPPTDIERLNAAGTVKAGWGESSRSMVVKFNNLVAPFADNVELRRALNHAVDRQGIIDAIYDGHGTVSQCQMLSPMYFGFNPDLKPYDFDPDKAREMIKATGLKQPISVELQVPLGRYLLGQEIGQAVAAQLQDVGLDVKVSEMEYATWSNAYTKGNMGQASFLGQAWPTLDADGLLGLYLPDNPGSYWKDETFGKLILEGRSTVDPDKRKEIYRKATERMCDQAPVVFLFNQPLTYATSSDHAWHVRGDDWVRAFDLTRN